MSYRIFSISSSRLLAFFFSSRRRHTRCSRDWSSDVCSSDLLTFYDAEVVRFFLPRAAGADAIFVTALGRARGAVGDVLGLNTIAAPTRRAGADEEVPADGAGAGAGADRSAAGDGAAGQPAPQAR